MENWEVPVEPPQKHFRAFVVIVIQGVFRQAKGLNLLFLGYPGMVKQAEKFRFGFFEVFKVTDPLLVDFGDGVVDCLAPYQVDAGPFF